MIQGQHEQGPQSPTQNVNEFLHAVDRILRVDIMEDAPFRTCKSHEIIVQRK